MCIRDRYLWLDATYVKCRDDDSRVCSQATVTAIGAFMDGTRRFVGFDLVDTESYDSWKRFLLSLRRRGVAGVRLVTSDAHAGLRRAIMEVFDGASWQRCFVHMQRDLTARIRHRTVSYTHLNVNQIAVAKEGRPLGGSQRLYHVHHRGTNARIHGWRRTRYVQGYDETQPQSQHVPAEHHMHHHSKGAGER